jgi:hypothetical protein
MQFQKGVFSQVRVQGNKESSFASLQTTLLRAACSFGPPAPSPLLNRSARLSVTYAWCEELAEVCACGVHSRGLPDHQAHSAEVLAQ